MNPTENPTLKRYREFSEFRSQTLSGMRQNLEARIRTNPNLSEDEIRLGAFLESIEPQIRGAVLDLNNKGYETRSSGFWAKHADQQGLFGEFKLDVKSKEELAKLGVEVIEEPDSLRVVPKTRTTIVFKPDEPDLEKIKKTWDRIVSLLPALGGPVRNMGFSAVATRYQFARSEGEVDIREIENNIQGNVYPQATGTELTKKIAGIRAGEYEIKLESKEKA